MVLSRSKGTGERVWEISNDVRIILIILYRYNRDNHYLNVLLIRTPIL